MSDNAEPRPERPGWTGTIEWFRAIRATRPSKLAPATPKMGADYRSFPVAPPTPMPHPIDPGECDFDD